MQLTKQDVKKIIEVCGNDGHSIIASNALHGVNPEFIQAITKRHFSDMSNPKSTITKDGQVKMSVTGVYTLEALRFACMILKVRYKAMLGRGFAAREMTEVLNKWVEEQK